jgi:hypothetical protein
MGRKTCKHQPKKAGDEVFFNIVTLKLQIMRRRIPYRVCSCMPNGVVTHLEACLLKDLVNR